MEIVKMLIPESKYSIKCPHSMNPEFIIIHNTANDASAMAEISYMIGNNKKVSFHCAIDNYRIVQGVPFDRNTWNATDGGNGTGNRKGIALEICYSKSGGERFEEAQKLAAEYTAYLLKKYNWGIDKVKKHEDFYPAKGCPHRTLSEGWQNFLNLVQSYMVDRPIDNNIESGSDEPVRTYQNGSTSENVYADTDCTKKIKGLFKSKKSKIVKYGTDIQEQPYMITSNNYI